MAASQMGHELLTLWFLRLNGYFCVPNFIIHPDAPGRGQRTDADVLAVRFPHCEEVAGALMPQDPSFVVQDRIDFVIAEVKAGKCHLNGPWTNPERKNIQYVLRWMGFVRRAGQLNQIADTLYERKVWRDRESSVRMICFGGKTSNSPSMRDVIQRTHRESVEFIADRFRRFDTHKADRQQWDDFIRTVFELVDQNVPTKQILRWVDGKG